MRIVLAPDSFKESMTAAEAAQAMAVGVRRVIPEAALDLVPMADGGEGTMRVLADALGGAVVEAAAHDALGGQIAAPYGYVENRQLAIIEMAAASGLAMIPPARRDVATASTFGTGEVIRDALDRGARHFIIGIGGSATNDAGAGMATALGVRFLDQAGAELPFGGAALAQLASIDITELDGRLTRCRFEVACDVDNPLLGPAGASVVFGPQKGATPELVTQLDRALTRWADVVEPAIGRVVRDLPGAGAAGGLGAGLAAFIPTATFRPGVEIVMDTLHLADHVRGADWVFTGEGSIDFQTLHGKTPWGVLQVANSVGVPVIMFGGAVTAEASVLLSAGAVALVPIVRRVQSIGDALTSGPSNLADAVEMTTRLITHSAKI